MEEVPSHLKLKMTKQFMRVPKTFINSSKKKKKTKKLRKI